MFTNKTLMFSIILSSISQASTFITNVTRIEPRRHQDIPENATVPNNFITTSNSLVTNAISTLDNSNNFAIQTIILTGDFDGDLIDTDTFSFDLTMTNNSGDDYNHDPIDNGYALTLGETYSLRSTNPQLTTSDSNISLNSYSLDLFSVFRPSLYFGDLVGFQLLDSNENLFYNAILPQLNILPSTYRVSEEDLILRALNFRSNATDTRDETHVRALAFTLTINTVPEPSTPILIAATAFLFSIRRNRKS